MWWKTWTTARGWTGLSDDAGAVTWALCRSLGLVSAAAAAVCTSREK